jgi:hypothetical protein
MQLFVVHVTPTSYSLKYLVKSTQYLFIHAFNCLDSTPSNDKMTSELWTGEDAEGIGRGLI